MATEQIDDFERQTRLKEVRLAYLRGDITLAEHDRRRARYEPTGAATEDSAAAILARHAVPERRKVSKFGQWLGRWMKH